MASENDIILFFSSTVLTSVLFSGLDLNTWMQSLLGYSALNNFPAPDNKPGNDGVFYLVIDGFDEYRIKDEQFDLILNQIVDFFSCYQTNNKFKLVLTMRTSTWVNNRHEMENSNSSWFTGFNDSEEAINVHLFNNAEIKQLSNNLNPNIKDAIPADLPDGFKHPLYFQLFYKQHKENFSFDSVDLTSEYELNSLFILNKIYLGKYSAEKILFIKKLVESMEFENENYRVDKLKVNDYVRKYDHAYKELLSAGILKELNESNNFQYNTYIKFDNDYFLVHSIAKTLLYSNDDRFDSVLVQKINTLFAKSPNKLSVLKWCIIHAIKTGQQDSFERLTEANLSSNEKSELIIFLGDLLNKEFTSMKGNELFFQYFNQDFSKKMFDYFFGIELISNDYKKTLYTILKFELSARKKILVYTALAITAVINLNLEDLEQHLKKLRSFPVSDYQSFAVNPLTCIDTLYHFLKYGIVKKDALTELTKLSFHPPEDEYNLTQCASNDMLYLLGMHTMFITYNAKKLLRFINVIGKFYKSDSLDVHTSQYGFFVNMLKGDAYYKLHQLDKVAEVYYMVSNAYKKSENLLTPYMKTQFHCLKIKLMIDTPREGSVINEMKCIDAISEISGSRVTRLYTLAMLQGKQEFMHEHPNFKKHVNYEYQKLMRTNNISSDMFTVQKSMVNK